jgi:beta-glucosidase
LPRTVGQIPLHHDTRAGGGRSMIYGDYFDGSVAPLFPFGFGLAYTTFAFSDLIVPETADIDQPFDVHVTVTNTGDRAGTEVVQLYVRDEVARVARPQRQLAGFARVELQPGEARTVRFTVDPTVVAYYDEAMELVVEPGAVRVIVGDLHSTVVLDGPERAIAPNDRRPTRVSVST